MARYKLLESAFINQMLYGEGAIVTVSNDVIPGPHMLPMDLEARKKAKEVGLRNDAVPNYMDEMTQRIDVTKFGASPQNVDAGISMDADVEGAPGPDLLRSA
jgi:hypothetical protein